MLALAAAATTAAVVGWVAFGQSESAAASRECPRQWRAGWQELANRIDAPVCCPTWIPSPLTGDIDGPYINLNKVDKDRSYLTSFIWKEREEEIHVNFRGYPGRTTIPSCQDTYTVAGKTRRRSIPCFSDLQGEREIAGQTVRVYRVNRDADAWHILYAWEDDGSLYTLSEHVGIPFGSSAVVKNLDRMMRGLARVEPRA